MLQPLFELVSHEVAVVGPSLETFSDQVVREAFELAVAVFHLVVLSVEYHRLLNLLNVPFVQDVLADTKFLQAEVGLQCVADLVAAMLCDPAIEDFKFN